MSEHTANPNASKAGISERKLSCEEWEALLVDFLDETLPAAEKGSFEAHQRSCASCLEVFSQASQGREWLGFLRGEPEVPAVLVAKILAQTTGAVAEGARIGEVAPLSVATSAPVLPFWKRTNGIAAVGRRAAQPRLMMTAAMAFFSITLTLNMAGIRLNAIRMADLKPSALSNNLNKQYHMASARVVRYYDNIRFVYEMEARVRELRRDADIENSTPPEQNQSIPSGTPQDVHKNGGKSEGPSSPQARPLPWGEQVVASLNQPGLAARQHRDAVSASEEQSVESDRETTDSRAADQAERGIA